MHSIRWIWLFPLVVAIGCGDGRVHLPTAPVSGTVVYRGKPLEGGRVLFLHSSGQAAAAEIAHDGSFTLSAIQGSNRVAIHCFRCVDDPSGPIIGVPPFKPVKSLVPERYCEVANSGLTVEVNLEGNSSIEFVLTD